MLCGMIRVEHEKGTTDVPCGPGRCYESWRVGALQLAGPRRSRIRRRVPARVFNGNRPPRYKKKKKKKKDQTRKKTRETMAIAESMLPEFDHETATTRMLLERVPGTKPSGSPM